MKVKLSGSLHPFVVNARPILFKDFKEFEFVLHLNPKEVNPDGTITQQGIEWRVSEKKTGELLVKGKTPNEVLKYAKQYLLDKGRERIREIISRNIMR